MKQFLVDILNRMWALTSYDQLEILGTEKSKELIIELLSECNKFSIHEHIKQKIIEEGLRNTPAEAKSFRGLSVALINTWFRQYLIQNPGTGRQPAVSADQQAEFDEIERKSKAELLEKKKENPNYNPRREFFDSIKNMGKLKSQVDHKPTKGNAEDVSYEEI